MLNDIRFALRQLRKSPGFTLVAVLMLALGIGANTALFSTFNTLVLRPVSLPEPDRLVRLFGSNAALGINVPRLSWPRYELIRDHQHSFVGVAAAAFTDLVVTREGVEAEQARAAFVSSNFFGLHGIPLLRGRDFSKEENAAGGPNAVIISHEYWQRALGGRDSVLGETLALNGEPHTIVGIAAPALSQPFRAALLFVARPFEGSGLPPTPEMLRTGTAYLSVTARLKPGVTLTQATAELATFAKNYRAAFPKNTDASHDTPLKLLADDLAGHMRPTFYLLLGTVGFVLLIGCANVAALFLSRLSARHREIAVRLALGASRWQLVRHFLIESALFSAAAGALGLLLASWSLVAIQKLAANLIPPGVTLELDSRALAFTAAAAALSTLIVGLVPALHASRASVADALKDSGRGSLGGARATRFRSGLIVGEVALSVVLLVASGLLLVSFVRLQRASPGFNPHGVATARLSLPVTARYADDPQYMQFYSQLIERLEAQPQVQRAAVAVGVPMSGVQPTRGYAVAGRPVPPYPERTVASLYLVTEHYFDTMQISLRTGRVFDAHDDARAPIVCLINESFAKRLFPGESALGKIILRGRDADVRCEIIGITADVKSAGLNTEPPDEMYCALRQETWRFAVAVVRTAGDPATLQSVIRAAVASVDSDQAIASFAPLESLLADSLGTQRIAAWLTGVFAALALLLSAVGLYSVLAYAVTQRTCEIGIRMALGAQRAQLVALVLRGGLKLVAVGLVAGLAAAGGAARLFRMLLFSVAPLDPVVYASVTLLFAMIAILACLVPSLRASRIDPIIALRTE
jgi:predicted permease